MANAVPSGPGRSARSDVRPESNIPKGTKTVTINGETFRETEMTNGNIRRTRVFPGDFPASKKSGGK